MCQLHRATAVIVAAGSSRRMGVDKLFCTVGRREVLLCSVQAFDTHPYIDEIIVVAGENLPQIEQLLQTHPPKMPCRVVPGGDSRTASVLAGVRASTEGLVAVHDGARPFVSRAVISRAVEAAAEFGAAAPAVPVKDTVKTVRDGFVENTPPRTALMAVQTPQVFMRSAFLEALRKTPPETYAQLTDDCMVLENAGLPVRLVEGEYANYKITTPEDLPAGDAGEKEGAMLRIGHGYDVHRFAAERKLILGGVQVPYEKGLLGHSDADVLLHAVSDALLGAAALGDIGRHFPDTDPAHKDADSLVLLQKVAQLLRGQGYGVCNIDATILCQAPKLGPHIPAMRANIAAAVGVAEEYVSVKATTEEGLGFTGSGEGIAAHCVALIEIH